MDYLTTHTSLSPIRCGFAPSFVNYKKGCTRLIAASDKVYQLFAHGRWFSPGTPASSTTKTGRHDIAEILLKVTLNTINQSLNQSNPKLKKLLVIKQRYIVLYNTYILFVPRYKFYSFCNILNTILRQISQILPVLIMMILIFCRKKKI